MVYEENGYKNIVAGVFRSLQELFGEKYLYVTPEKTSLYFEMKHAFRVADDDITGTIGKIELKKKIL